RSSSLVRALVAGSAARGTFLQDRLDVDLFLLFPPDLSRDRLREEGLALGRAVLSNPETRYAEHPYLRGTFEGFTVDAVPGITKSDPSHPLSPVDRTPFHQEYLAARETPELVEQVRLAKQFFRSLGVYGSEARTEGLSGYLVELLVLRFGSLRKILVAARDWRVPVRLATSVGSLRGSRRMSPSCSPTPSTRTGTWRVRYRAETWACSFWPPERTSTTQAPASSRFGRITRSRRR